MKPTKWTPFSGKCHWRRPCNVTHRRSPNHPNLRVGDHYPVAVKPGHLRKEKMKTVGKRWSYPYETHHLLDISGSTPQHLSHPAGTAGTAALFSELGMDLGSEGFIFHQVRRFRRIAPSIWLVSIDHRLYPLVMSK